MKQSVEIFFALPPDNSVEAVVMPRTMLGPLPQQIAFAYRLVGRYAIMDATLCDQWESVVISSPEFAKAHQATPGKQRKPGTRLCFLNAARGSDGDLE